MAPARGMAWDCACGTGQATLPLAERFGHVIATDLSAEQLRHTPSHSRVDQLAARWGSGARQLRWPLTLIAGVSDAP